LPHHAGAEDGDGAHADSFSRRWDSEFPHSHDAGTCER
jgi:hypothetical protein